MCYDTPVERKWPRKRAAGRSKEDIKMSTSWAFGFAIGIMVVAILTVVALKCARRGGAGKGKYDERQMVARGRAYTWGYATLLIYLVFWLIMRSMEIPFFMEAVSVLIGALLSIAVFVGYCIFHDAYFKASESPKAWIAIICAMGVVNLGIGLVKLFREATLQERLYDNMNLFVGALMVFALICLLVKRAVDRQSEAD